MEEPKTPRSFSFKRILLLITYAVLLFLFIYRLDAVWSGVRWVLGALSALFTGMALAFLFHIPMEFFQYKVLRRWENHRSRMLRKLWRGMSLVLAYVTVIAFVLGLLVLVIPRAVESITTLATNFSGYLSRFQVWADGVLTSLSINPDISSAVADIWEQLTGLIQTLIGQIVSGAFDFTVSFTSGITDFLLAFIFSGFLLYNRQTVFKQLRRLSNALLGQKRTDKAAEILNLSDNIFGRFIMGQLTEALILGVLCFIGMTIFGMDYALLISTIIAVTAIVPIIGPIIGTVPCAIILLVIDPMQALWFVIFIIVLQQIEGDLIYPRVVGNAIGLSGMWVLFSLIVGGGLFGIWGMLLGTPIFAVIYHLVERWLEKKDKIASKE